MLEDRKKSYERKCGGCNSAIVNAEPFLRWYTNEFCGTECFGRFIETNIGLCCHACDSIIGKTKLCIYTECIENELRHFCSRRCKDSYMQTHKLCEYCQKILIEPSTCEEATKRFCSTDCEEKHQKMHGIIRKGVVKPCTDCGASKPVLVDFDYNGQLYSYCSYSCFFFLKFSCGIYAGK